MFGSGNLNYYQLNKTRILFGSLLDVSTAIVIPVNQTHKLLTSGTQIYPCLFYNPTENKFEEFKGVKIKLQDIFFNIRDNRKLAWVCVDYFKLLFTKIDPEIRMTIVNKTFNNEFIVKLYSSNYRVLHLMGNIYKKNSEQYMKYIDLIEHQYNSCGEVCLNDIFSLYSKWIIENQQEQSTLSVNHDDYDQEPE